MSDDSRQDAATDAAQSKYLLQLLKQKNILHTTRSTIWDNTDGCYDKYIRAPALYLLSVLSHAHEIIIDSGAGAPGHGKYVVDGLNATDRRYL